MEALKQNDIALNADLDLLIGDDGDFVVEETTQQHIYLNLISQKGEWKQNPTLGIGIEDMLGDDEASIEKSIREGLQYDGSTVNSINFKNGEMKIDAQYNG